MRAILFFILITCSVYVPVFAQEEIIVLMKTEEGYGPFKPGKQLTLAIDKKPDIKGIPTGLTGYVIRDIDCQSYNSDYKTVLAYGVTKADFISHFKKVPEALITDRDYKHRFFILVGKNDKNQVTVIPDLNRNLSFDDDQVFTFPVLETLNEQKQATKNLPSVIFPFEYYNGRQILSLPTRVYLDPYKRSLNFNLTDSIENRYFLGLSIAEHKKGSFVYKKQRYEVFITNYSNGLEYLPSKTALLASAGGKLKTEPEGNTPYYQSDVISVNGQFFQFVSLSRLGDTVRLKYAGANVKNEGFTEGTNVPDLQAMTVTGEHFQLSALKGKYVLLDFWGTWCRPCVQLIPRLKILQEKYNGKNFALVSVANEKDKAKLTSFISENNMNWQQVYQNDKGPAAETALLKELKISEYPTTILIDPTGKILLRGKDLDVIDRFLAQKLAP
jgi:thiol-disulfide isomerase/thioredoxin